MLIAYKVLLMLIMIIGAVFTLDSKGKKEQRQTAAGLTLGSMFSLLVMVMFL